MTPILPMLASALLGSTPAPIGSMAPSITQRNAPQLSDVLMAWRVGESDSAETIELLREGSSLVMRRTPAQGDATTVGVRLSVDDGKAVYMPIGAETTGFYVVKPDGSLELHEASGKLDASPTLVSVSDAQRQMLDTLAPAESTEPASWTDVINSLTGDESKTKDAGGEAGANAPSTDPSRLDIEKLEDGTKRINDRFILAGDGSKAKPYRVTWDYLTSVREGYQPREGMTQIPAHVKMLDGKYVRIGGYLQFPLATPEPKELLVMLNQWDGCCIGIPPTPYDAIEVSLAQSATRGEKFAVEGALVGKLKIDPYLVGDWLIGLYLIGDASLDISGSRPAEEVYGNSPTVGDPNAMPGH